MWDTANTVLWRKLIPLNAYITKEETSQIKDLSFQETGKLILKTSKKKRIKEINITVEINEREKKNKENLWNQKLTLRFEISEINIASCRVDQEKRKKTQVTNFRSKKDNKGILLTDLHE